MHCAVHFDHQPLLGAEEVHNKWANRLLSPELTPVELLSAQRLPEQRLAPRRHSAQLDGALSDAPAARGAHRDALPLPSPREGEGLGVGAPAPLVVVVVGHAAVSLRARRDADAMVRCGAGERQPGAGARGVGRLLRRVLPAVHRRALAFGEVEGQRRGHLETINLILREPAPHPAGRRAPQILVANKV